MATPGTRNEEEKKTRTGNRENPMSIISAYKSKISLTVTHGTYLGKEESQKKGQV